MLKAQDLSNKTIADFGTQWSHFTNNEGYYGSRELLQDILGPHTDLRDLSNKSIVDVGSGTGRIVNMLLAAEAAHVTAIEPSNSFNVLKTNTAGHKHKITYLQTTGEHIPLDRPFDYVISFGVIHHIPDPGPVIQASHKALRRGGKIILWLYAYEGNELYLSLAIPLRYITKRIPHRVLLHTASCLTVAAFLYGSLCRFLPLPMRIYMQYHFNRLTLDNKIMTIYDQLNPSYSKYYTKQEAFSLLADAGFTAIKLHHRHRYSWTVTGTKS